MNRGEVKNAEILYAKIYVDDHDFLTAWLHLDYGDCVQGFGGYCMYNPSFPNAPSTAGLFIWRVMETVGVKEWSELKGESIRAVITNGLITGIGHIIKDKWFYPKVEFDALFQMAKEKV